jgi:hypothetical protein
VLAGAAVVAAVVARKADTPDTHSVAAEELAVAAAEVHCAPAWEAAGVSTGSSGFQATCAAFEDLGRASAAAVAVAAAVARRPHTRRQRKARRWSAGCRWVIRSLLCRVLGGFLNSMCGYCWGGFGLGSRRRAEGRRTTLRRLVGVWVCGLQLKAGVVVAGLGCLRG